MNLESYIQRTYGQLLWQISILNAEIDRLTTANDTLTKELAATKLALEQLTPKKDSE